MKKNTAWRSDLTDTRRYLDEGLLRKVAYI